MPTMVLHETTASIVCPQLPSAVTCIPDPAAIVVTGTVISTLFDEQSTEAQPTVEKVILSPLFTVEPHRLQLGLSQSVLQSGI